MKLVSVIIPTYKRPESLLRAIDSVLKQTYSNIEIIVVDDNGTNTVHGDETANAMYRYKDNVKIRYIRHTNNVNGSEARNTGIKNAKGNYITFLDDDDEYLNNKIELQTNKLESLSDEWGAVYTHFIRRKNGRIFDIGIEESEGFILDKLLLGEIYISAGSNLMVRKEVIDNIGPFNTGLSRFQDLEFFLRLAEKYMVACVNEICLVIYKDDTSNRDLDIQNQKKNIELYLGLVKPFVYIIPNENKKNIEKSQYLGIARYYITKLKFHSLVKHCKQYNISCVDVVRYLAYIVNRRINKKCYGFKL